jgi:light-regulated signal transduction histidine kinase (bacteriophytochrome)
VRGQSKPWTLADIKLSEGLRITLLEVILRLAESAAQERKASNERQELLIAELNHRVRNILGLIRGLISQGRERATTLEEFASVIGGRVQAWRAPTTRSPSTMGGRRRCAPCSPPRPRPI